MWLFMMVNEKKSEMVVWLAFAFWKRSGEERNGMEGVSSVAVEPTTALMDFSIGFGLT